MILVTVKNSWNCNISCFLCQRNFSLGWWKFLSSNFLMKIKRSWEKVLVSVLLVWRSRWVWDRNVPGDFLIHCPPSHKAEKINRLNGSCWALWRHLDFLKFLSSASWTKCWNRNSRQAQNWVWYLCFIRCLLSVTEQVLLDSFPGSGSQSDRCYIFPAERPWPWVYRA